MLLNTKKSLFPQLRHSNILTNEYINKQNKYILQFTMDGPANNNESVILVVKLIQL